jgi:hypothetical protein
VRLTDRARRIACQPVDDESLACSPSEGLVLALF